MKQSERKEVLVLLSQLDRRDLRRYINECWECEEDEIQSPELCVEKLLSLYPEKKICTKHINVPSYTDEEIRESTFP